MNNRIIENGLTLVALLIGMVGVLIAWQLAFPELNVEPYLNLSRLRPLHTLAVIFAFGIRQRPRPVRGEILRSIFAEILV